MKLLAFMPNELRSAVTEPRFPLWRRCLRVGALSLPGVAAALAVAQPIPVPNGSFESPTPPPGFPATPLMDAWQKTPQPDWYDPSATGIDWSQLSGQFPNLPPGDPGHIPNVDGAQAAYLFAIPGVGIFQELGATYQVGLAYEMTVGLMGAGGMAEGGAINLSLYYRDGTDAIVPVATTTVTYLAAGFPNPTYLYDFGVQTPFVQETDAWAGKNIGVGLFVTAGTGTGYWDVDNVRVHAVPEPGPAALLLAGLAGWWCLRRRVG